MVDLAAAYSLIAQFIILGFQSFTGLSRNRHVLYCRQKLLRQYHSRRKSCTHCRRTKTRCSEVTPQCARCKTKRLKCIYDYGHPKDSSLQLQGREENKSRKDVGIGPAGSTTDQVSLPGHLWQMSTIESRDLSCEDDISWNTHISLVTTLYDPLIDSGHGKTLKWISS
jgi:hypothetical protein